MARARPDLKRLPSVDEVLRTPVAVNAVDRFGRLSVLTSIRGTLAAVRAGHADISERPDDIAAAVIYLAQAKTITGVTLPADGGQHLSWRTPDSEVVE